MMSQCERKTFPERVVAGIVSALVALLLASAVTAGSCEALSATSSILLGYGTDYLPRLDLQSGEGGDGGCALSLPAVLPGSMSLALQASNLQGEATGARMRLTASVPITGFRPASGLALIRADGPSSDGRFWFLDLELSGSFCGPARLGDLDLQVPAGTATLFADAAGFGGSGAPVITGTARGELPAVSPRHGAYAGAPDPYHCQLPLCREPHAPVRDFRPLQSGGAVIELGWIAGGGDFTMIRYRADGTCPTSVFDGELLNLIPTASGQAYALIHDNPTVLRYWYTAFSVTMTGDTVTLGSRLECDSFTTAAVDPSIPAAQETWGSVKQAYR